MAGSSRRSRSWIIVPRDQLHKTICSGPVEKGVKLYQFRISLDDTDPEVWRRVQIPGDFTIAQFGRAVVKSMGWIPNYWYLFYGPDGEIIEDSSRDTELASDSDKNKGESKTKDATKIKVSELYSMRKRTSMLEMGTECWIHVIELEEIQDNPGRKWYPKCIAGANACPPEDCGGSPGYEDLKAAIRDPKHEDHDKMKEWLVIQGYKKFNPKKFKVSDIQFYD